ncbi:MAG: PilZ domain-containing protein [Myxococcota bacterium]
MPASALAVASHERREHVRHEIAARIGMTSETNFWTGLTENVSEGGVFVAMPSPPPVGASVAITVQLDGGEPITVDGEVRWHRLSAEGHVCGCGIRFVDLGPRDVESLQRMLDTSGQPPLWG